MNSSLQLFLQICTVSFFILGFISYWFNIKAYLCKKHAEDIERRKCTGLKLKSGEYGQMFRLFEEARIFQRKADDGIFLFKFACLLPFVVLKGIYNFLFIKGVRK